LAETGRFSGQFVISETMRSGMCVAMTPELIAVLSEALGLPFVRLVDLGVVEQFARALKAGVEMLLASVAVAFEEIAATLSEDHQRSAVANGDGPDEVILLQMPEVAAARVERLALAVTQVLSVGHTEGLQR
jgi:hypothetical protein